MKRIHLLVGLVGWALAWFATAQVAPLTEVEAMNSPACKAARERLDALMAEDKPDLTRLRAARQRGARACFRTEADADRPARLERPEVVRPLAPAAAPPPLAPLQPITITPPAAAQPAQVQRCDEGGCWDSQGQRLPRVGPQLATPQGQLCTQQGTVLNCP
jgi:hypothetical protein